MPEPTVRLAQRTLDMAFHVHTELGPGCLETVYEHCLARALTDDGCRVERQVPVPLMFRGQRLPIAFRADLIVESALIVEVKALAAILPIHIAQTTTYLRLTGLPVALLLNFGAEHLRDGYERLVHPRYAYLPPSRA